MKPISKYSYRRKLLIYYLSVFILFLVITGIFQYSRERTYRIGQLETSLDDMCEMSRKYINNNNILESNNYSLLDSLKSIFPQREARVTIIELDGKVLYDSSVEDYSNMNNHSDRPEIQQAIIKTKGASQRKSATTGKKYYYYAKKADNYLIRSSVVYNVTIDNFLKANISFFYFIFLLFISVWIMLWWVTKRFSKSIATLQEFAISAGDDTIRVNNMNFANDEIGVIGEQIVTIYGNLQSTKQELSIEKERIFRHLNTVNQGVAIFSSEKELLLSNQHFVNYANLISDQSLKNETDIFKLPELKKLNMFINKRLVQDKLPAGNKKVEKQVKIEKNHRFFLIKCIIFIDRSFELIITNITKKEKNKIIKNEMSSNIAHELNTPVSAVQAYLETILSKPDLDEKKRLHFLEKAYGQVERLGILIADISTVYKMERAGTVFKKNALNLYDLLINIHETSQLRLEEKKMNLEHNFYQNLVLSANDELIRSVFQNLIDNSISYAGNGSMITISMYNETKNYYFFSFSDNGVGIPAEHHDRIFERFYRVDSGRTRKTGGSGIGLSIVKNAVKFHRGEISAKSKKGAGVEFLFTLRKF